MATVQEFDELVNKISIDKLLEINRLYTYDDVGIQMMDYCLQLVILGRDDSPTAAIINTSSLKNIISSGLDNTRLTQMFDWNAKKWNHQQKPDAVFKVTWVDIFSSEKYAHIYYECDALSKNVRPRDKEKIAVKMFQDTTGCHFVNPDVPAITIRSNIFKGPKTLVAHDEEFLAAVKAAQPSEQKRLLAGAVAENALAFLYSLCVAHLWAANQTMLVLQQKGVLDKVARAPDGRRYDLHLFIGRFRWTHQEHLNMFEDHLQVHMQNYSYTIKSAALVQVLAVERFAAMAEFKAELTRQRDTAGGALFQARHIMTGLLDIVQLWQMVQILNSVYTNRVNAGANALPGVEYPTWEKITDVLGNLFVVDDMSSNLSIENVWQPKLVSNTPELWGGGANRSRRYAAPADEMRLGTITVPVAMDDTFSTQIAAAGDVGGIARNVVQDIVALYHGNMIARINQQFSNTIEYTMTAQDTSYLPLMQTLKERCKNMAGSIIGRVTTTPMDKLLMHNDIGHRQNSQSLEALVLRDMHDKLPLLDPELIEYLKRFNAPNIALFLRMIRCSNLLALRQLSETLSTELVSSRYEHLMVTLPLGSVSELQHVMDFTRMYAKHKIASKLVLPAIQPTTAIGTPTLTKTQRILKHIRARIVMARAAGNSDDFEKTPFNLKLSLCSRALSRLVQSIHRKVWRANGDTQEFIFRHDKTSNPQDSQDARIAMHIITDALSKMYRPETVYFLSAGWPLMWDHNDDYNNVYVIPSYIDPAHELVRLQALEYDVHAQHPRSPSNKWIQLSWPARDSNITTRPRSMEFRSEAYNGTARRHNFYDFETSHKERARMHDEMDSDEASMFTWMINDTCLGDTSLDPPVKARLRNVVPTNVLDAIQETHLKTHTDDAVRRIRAQYDARKAAGRVCLTDADHAAVAKLATLATNVAPFAVLSPTEVTVCLRWKRLGVATIFMSAVNGLLFQAFEAHKERRETQSMHAADSANRAFINNLPFSYAFEYSGGAERYIKRPDEIWQNNARLGINNQAGQTDNVLAGCVFYRKTMEMPLHDYFVLGARKNLMAIARTRCRSSDKVNVNCDTWVFGETISKHRHELWVRRADVPMALSVKVESSNVHETACTLRGLRSGTIGNYTPINNTDDFINSRWSTYIELFGNHADVQWEDADADVMLVLYQALTAII